MTNLKEKKEKYSNGGGVDDVSESMAKQSLMKLKESGEISQLRAGVHGQVFMSIKGGQLKSYDNYKDAYAHYNKNKYANGGGVGEYKIKENGKTITLFSFEKVKGDQITAYKGIDADGKEHYFAIEQYISGSTKKTLQ